MRALGILTMAFGGLILYWTWSASGYVPQQGSVSLQQAQGVGLSTPPGYNSQFGGAPIVINPQG